MNDDFTFSIRIISDDSDFINIIPEMSGYKITYHKKGDNLTKNRVIKSKANVLVIHDFYKCSCIDETNNSIILSKLLPIMKTLSIIKTNDIKRELYITGKIENQQFGFNFDTNILNLLNKNEYSLSFSGVSYL